MRKNIDHTKASEALVGDGCDYPIPEWAFQRTVSKAGKAEPARKASEAKLKAEADLRRKSMIKRLIDMGKGVYAKGFQKAKAKKERHEGLG